MAQAGLRGETVEKVHRTHRTLASFPSNRDRVYRMVKSQLETWVNNPPDNTYISRQISSPFLDTSENSNSRSTERISYFEVFRKRPIPFLGREEELDRISRALTDPRGDHGIAIWGLGDIGKSSLAVEYAFIHEKEYSTVWLFECSSEVAIKESLEKLFRYLQKVDDPQFKVISGHAAEGSDAVLMWAKRQSNWLFIYDNYEPGSRQPNGSQAWDLEKYLPDSRKGHHIVISRSQDVCKFAARKLELRELDYTVAIDVLLHHADLQEREENEDDRKIAYDIVELMEGMPGNIEAAGRLICTSNLSLKRYYSDLNNKVKNMEDAGSKADSGSIYACYHVTLDNLEKRAATTNDTTHVNAIRLLRLFAVLYGHEISELLYDHILPILMTELTNYSMHRAASMSARWGQNGMILYISARADKVDGEILAILADADSYSNAIKVLSNFGLIRRERTDMTIHVHQVVQDVVYGRLRETERVALLKCGIRFVSHAFPENESIDGAFDLARARLTNHVQRCLDLAEPLIKTADVDQLDEVLDPFVLMLLSALGTSGSEHSFMSLAERLVERSNDRYHHCLRAKWRAYM
jgi:hypothetical protein